MSTQQKMTFIQGLEVSWKRELEIGDPGRLLRLAFFTVYFTAINLLFFMFPNALIWVANALHRVGKRLSG